MAPLCAEAWKAKKALNDERTVLTWLNAQLSARAIFTSGYVCEAFLGVFCGCGFDLDDAIPTEAEFSYAIEVMDRCEGWEKESWAAC